MEVTIEDTIEMDMREEVFEKETEVVLSKLT